MTDTKAIARVEPQELSDPLTSFLERAAKDPTIDVDKLERLLAMKEKVDAQERHRRFMDALARLQARLPQIGKSGHVVINGQLRSKYARLEDIDAAIRPLCTEEGFAFSFDSKPVQGGVEYSCEMTHRDGWSETKTITLPVDKGAGRNDVQAMGSTTSYARRYLLEMHLNLVKRDEDDDGVGGRRPITPDQVDTLRRMMADTKTNEAKFLNWLAARTLEEVPAANYDRAIKALEEKGRGQ